MAGFLISHALRVSLVRLMNSNMEVSEFRGVTFLGALLFRESYYRGFLLGGGGGGPVFS